MFIQPDQIRAARAMLDWSQQDLADAAGVSKDTVKNYELSHNKPNTQTLSRIVSTLELAGIDFVSEGVRKQKKEIQILEGKQGIKSLLDLVYQACREDEHLTIQVANADEALFVQWMAEHDAPHRERMEQLGPRQIQSIVRDDVLRTVAGEYSQYKTLDRNQFGKVIIYIFGKHTALIEMSENNCKITLIENPLLGETMTRFFSVLWESAKPL